MIAHQDTYQQLLMQMADVVKLLKSKPYPVVSDSHEKSTKKMISKKINKR